MTKNEIVFGCGKVHQPSFRGIHECAGFKIAPVRFGIFGSILPIVQNTDDHAFEPTRQCDGVAEHHALPVRIVQFASYQSHAVYHDAICAARGINPA